MIPFYVEHGGWLHIPKGYPLTERGAWLFRGDAGRLAIEEGRSQGHPLPHQTRVCVTFGEAPYPAGQPEFIREMVRAARANTHGGLALAPTRAGKTLCALAAACRLGGSTLILVDRAPLMQQWREAVEKHVRDGKDCRVPVGIVREDRFEVPPSYPFVVATLQTLVRRELEPDVRRAFRTVIVDECQSAPCDMVWTALRRVASHYVFGMTATPDRGDGLGPAIPWLIGPEVAHLHRDLHADVCFLQHQYADTPILRNKGSKKLRHARLTIEGRVNTNEAEKALAADQTRVDRIADEARKAVAAGRQVLILAGLRDHVARIARALRERDLHPGVYVGGQASPSEMAKNPVVATYGIAAKGVDFQPPPTLCILAGPRSDVRQAIGRVLQPQAPCKPMILDIVDGASPLIGQAHRRLRFYLDRGFDVQNRVWE